MLFKPQTIQYGGYRMRSKLEAKWAVFLDYLQIEYRYEPRVYSLKGNIGYLPDFYLPEQDVFLEIKPDKPLSDEDSNKIKLFSIDEIIRPNLVVLFGEPSIFQDTFFHVRGVRWEKVQWAWDGVKARLQNPGIIGADPHHPAIYGAVEESINRLYIPVDKQSVV